MDTRITTDHAYRRIEQAYSTELGDEFVIMHMESGNYITLNKLGKMIWAFLASPTTIDQIVAQLLEQFEVDEATCKQETMAFLEQLAANQLIAKQ